LSIVQHTFQGRWGPKRYWETGKLLGGSKKKWTLDLKVIKQTIRFLQYTGWLAHNQIRQE
jgi:hypothetical protein